MRGGVLIDAAENGCYTYDRSSKHGEAYDQKTFSEFSYYKLPADIGEVMSAGNCMRE